MLVSIRTTYRNPKYLVINDNAYFTYYIKMFVLKFLTFTKNINLIQPFNLVYLTK